MADYLTALTLVHEQKNEIRVNKVIYLTLKKALCVSARFTSKTDISNIKKETKKKKLIINLSHTMEYSYY